MLTILVTDVGRAILPAAAFQGGSGVQRRLESRRQARLAAQRKSLWRELKGTAAAPGRKCYRNRWDKYHSHLRHTAGSTRVARSDGMYAAASPTTISIAIAPPSVM